ncbi:odorant receptor 13a-like [Colias croceus]|uniref:odorant receptor 13a-like n=1 Tax=Colias crocea TaxID=72248 RepID=UPI001E27B717|nr:odorant receptor 13a-like [Colias croceus]
MSTLKFNREYKIANIALKIGRSSPYATYDIWHKINTFVYVFVSCFCFVFLTYSIIFHDIPKQNYSEATKNVLMSIIATIIVFKLIILYHHRLSVIRLIQIMDEDYEAAQHFPEEDKFVILKYSQKGKSICVIWCFIAGYTALVFPSKAMYSMACSYINGEFTLVPMFDMTYPQFINDHKYEPFVYCLLFLVTSLFALFASSMYIGFDPLAPIFVLHTCGQLHLLSRRILKIFDENCHPSDVKKNLKNINIKLASIYSFVKEVQDVFTVMFEYNLKITTILIPMAAFQIFESLRRYEFNAEFTVFFFGTLCHFYFPCYYSDQLMETSEMMRQAIYSCGWENNTSIENKKIILFMLTRTTIPLVIRTIFYPICLDTFAEMCRQSFAIYNIMNAAWV